MDFANTNRPAVVGIHILPPRIDAATTRGAVAVELPPERTVQSAPAGEAVRLDLRQQDDAADRDRPEQAAQRKPAEEDAMRREMRDVIERRLMIDPDTRSVVMQKRDRSTGETVVTVPDEMSLKLRQYSRELTEQERQDAEGPRYVERIA